MQIERERENLSSVSGCECVLLLCITLDFAWRDDDVACASIIKSVHTHNSRFIFDDIISVSFNHFSGSSQFSAFGPNGKIISGFFFSSSSTLLFSSSSFLSPLSRFFFFLYRCASHIGVDIHIFGRRDRTTHSGNRQRACMHA